MRFVFKMADFNEVQISNWSQKHTEEWLKACLNKYQLDDPVIYTKILIKGKTLLMLHEHRELNKYISQENANILYGDLDGRLGKKISTNRKPSFTPPWDKFERQLDEINVDFEKMVNKSLHTSDNKTPPYANEVMIEALYALKGIGTVIPIECLFSRMVNTFSKQYKTPFKCTTPIQHLEYGHVKLHLPIDEAVGAYVQKFLLHGYPSLAELTLENILYLGKKGSIDTNFNSQATIIVPKISADVRAKGSLDDGYVSTEPSPRTSWAENPSSPMQRKSSQSNFKMTLKPLKELTELSESESNSGITSPVYEPVSEERNEDSVRLEGNSCVVDLTNEIADSEKLSFDYDQNLIIKFDVTASGENSNIITDKSSSFKVRIENGTRDDIGFSLRTYNLSSPGDIKVLHSQPGLTFQILKGENGEKIDWKKKHANAWEQDIELIDQLIGPSGDYLMFELVVCSLKPQGNTWNILRNSIRIKSAPDSNKSQQTEQELRALRKTLMGNEKRKRCFKILLDSLYYFSNENLDQAYWLATQMLLLPDFQRPQLLVFCWAIIGTCLYQSKALVFSEQKKLIALINAVNEIKKKLDTLQTNILSNVVSSTGRSIATLQGYLDRHKLKKSHSCPKALSIPAIPLIIEPIQETAPDSPKRKIPFSLHESTSEPNLRTISTSNQYERLKTKELLLQYTSSRLASRNTEVITFGDCTVICPPSRMEIEVKFGYAIMNSVSCQATVVPDVSHLATLRLESNLEERYVQPYEIKFPKPRKVSQSMTFRVVCKNGVVSEDITEQIQTDFESKVWSIMAPRNGIYVILGVESLPRNLTSYVANDIMSLRPLYVQLWFKSFGEYGKWGELWCCISCKQDLLIRPPHTEAWPLNQLNLQTRYNDKIEFSMLPKSNQASIPNILPDMKYEFLLTDTQGIFNFVQIVNLEATGSEVVFQMKTPENVIKKDILIGTFL